MNIQKWLQANTHDLTGKVVAVTGAAGGLGRHLCHYLAQLHAHLILLDRDAQGNRVLKEALQQSNPDVVVETMTVDLDDLNAVHTVVQQLSPRQIDFLVLNAGVYNVPLHTSALGYNNVFQINFISQYHLAKALMPTLAKTNGKVIATTSIAHTYGRLDENDVDYTQHRKATKIYGNSKRFLMFALALVHPGVTLTPMTNHYHPAINWLVKLSMKMTFPKPATAALNILAGLFRSLTVDEWVGPAKAGIWGRPTVQRLTNATPAERAKIFAYAEKIDQQFVAAVTNQPA